MTIRVLDYSPHPYQRLFHQDPSRFKIIVGGRRVGKTVMAIQEIIKHCLEGRNRLAFWIAPTFRDAREIGFEEFLNHFETLEPVIHQVHSTQLKVTFNNGSSIYFKGSDNPDSLRGRGLTLAIFDEAAFCKDSIWPQIVRPALSDKKGKGILISTPNGFNWFKDIYDKGEQWSKFYWPTSMNPLITPEELDSVKAEISEIDFRQEYLAEFITRAGRVYPDFDENNVISNYNLQDYDIYLGMDFGYAGFTAIAFLAVDRATQEKIIQFDELVLTRTQMDDVIDRIFIKLGEHKLSQGDVRATYTDPAGNADELSSGLSPVDMLRNKGFNVINKGSTIPAGLAMVRSFIKNTLGQRKFFVTPNCSHTIDCFRAYQYSERKGIEEPLKDGVFDHMMDAIRYFFVNKFDQARWVAKVPEQTPYTKVDQSKVVKRCNKCRRPFISHTPKDQPPFVCNTCK
jgi:phage terminase large subunit